MLNELSNQTVRYLTYVELIFSEFSFPILRDDFSISSGAVDLL